MLKILHCIFYFSPFIMSIMHAVSSPQNCIRAPHCVWASINIFLEKIMQETLHNHISISISGRLIWSPQFEDDIYLITGTNSKLQDVATDWQIVLIHMEWRPALKRTRSCLMTMTKRRFTWMEYSLRRWTLST